MSNLFRRPIECQFLCHIRNQGLMCLTTMMPRDRALGDRLLVRDHAAIKITPMITPDFTADRRMSTIEFTPNGPETHPHEEQNFDEKTLFCCKLLVGHGELLLQRWLVVLPTLPETSSCPSVF